MPCSRKVIGSIKMPKQGKEVFCNKMAEKEEIKQTGVYASIKCINTRFYNLLLIS